jgi:hypothetical protein
MSEQFTWYRVPRGVVRHFLRHLPGFRQERKRRTRSAISHARAGKAPCASRCGPNTNNVQNVQRMRENSQNMIRPGMMPNQYAMRNMRNGMVNGAAIPNADMAKRM